MSEPSINRTPYEIWERILFEVIAVNGQPVFDVTCTPSSYLAFKGTCGGGREFIHRYRYIEAEKIRRSLRLVCQAWSVFANRWDVQVRWRQFSSSRSIETLPPRTWRGFQRLDFGYRAMYIKRHERGGADGMHPRSGIGKEVFRPNIIVSMINTWRTCCGVGMRLRRLELLQLSQSRFETVFSALCGASSVLKELLSLGIAIPDEGDTCPLRRLSTHFPQLVHLTLIAGFMSTFVAIANERKASESRQHDELKLEHLEALFLMDRVHFQLVNWSVPALRHFYVRQVVGLWKDNVVPFLERHAGTIETLDLDDSHCKKEILTPTLLLSADPRTIDFWEIFPRLTLLRCNLSHGRFQKYPGEQHTLEFLVNTEPIMDEESLVMVLGPWIEEPGIKRMGSIVLFGPYLSEGVYGPVKGLLQKCKQNGTKLCSPDGSSWIDQV